MQQLLLTTNLNGKQNQKRMVEHAKRIEIASQSYVTRNQAKQVIVVTKAAYDKRKNAQIQASAVILVKRRKMARKNVLEICLSV